MNHGNFKWNGGDKNGAEAGKSGDCCRDELSKEQLKCFESAFIKLLSTNDMKEKHTNWEEFYDLLNEACGADISTLNNTPPRHRENAAGANFSNDSSDIKVDAEATKQQYGTCNSTSKPSLFDQNNTSRHERTGDYCKQNGNEFVKNDYKQNCEGCNSSFNGTNFADQIKKNNVSVPKSTKNTKRKLSQNSKTSKNKTSESKETSHSTDDSKSHKEDPRITNYDKYISLDFFKSHAHDFYLKYTRMMTYLSTTSKWCWAKMIEIILFLLCILLIVVVAVWRLAWFLICVIFKVTLFAVLWVACKLLNFVYIIHLRHDVFGKIRCYVSNGCDLLFYITGINLKSIFARKKKESFDEQKDDNVPLTLPTSPEDAVVHLIQQTEDKPFKVLCVTRQSTNDEIKTNYRKMALLVHPDKCLHPQADEAFKVLDSAFKTVTDPEKRNKLMEEEKRSREWDEFTKRYAGFEEDFETMFNDILNSISCSKCLGKHKRTLVKDRTFYDARYCGECRSRHSANDGDIWAESNIFGLNWTCYVCMDGEIYELTEWAECQKLRNTIPINGHRVVCRLGNQKQNTTNGGNRRRNKQSESSEPKKTRKKRKQKGRK